MFNEVAKNMQYVQELFLEIPSHINPTDNVEQIIFLLDKEPIKFRSIAYESASWEIAMEDLKSSGELYRWTDFYYKTKHEHPYHVEIGLGWAFAKTGIYPPNFINTLNKEVRRMVYDGVGYYYALYRRRRTIVLNEIPEEISQDDLSGFTQGVGRRLWYEAKGDVNYLLKSLEIFSNHRLPDLWRGIGIACGYVGGNNQLILDRLLLKSADFKSDLKIGVQLAVLSRQLSKSISKDIKLTSEIICKMTISDLQIASKAVLC